MKANDPTDVEQLRARIDDAMRKERPSHEIVPLLQRLLAVGGESDDVYVYAHRSLAELSIESDPWRAALHLRRVLRAGAATDRVHALMGLCQALLGNFESAVVHYERALALAPTNAWYHHNVGHLFDVALGSPRRALRHLRQAHDAEPIEDEVTASLAHCLARLRQLGEAEVLALEASQLAPDKEAHRALLSWIRAGAPGGWLHAAAEDRLQRDQGGDVGRIRGAEQGDDETEERALTDRDVLRVLDRGLSGRPERGGLRGAGQRLWLDYRAKRPRVRVGRPEVQAAALEYALSVIHEIRGATQSAIAKRYGVSSTALANRYGDMRSALQLKARDARYLR